MVMNRAVKTALRTLAIGVSAAAVAGACASSASPAASAAASSAGVAGATSAPSMAASAAASMAAASMAAASMAPSAEASGGGTVYTVNAVTKSGLGTFLTGEDGKTLYTLRTDAMDKTTCTGGCATAWPPFTLDPGESTAAGAGVTVKLGTMKRPDGSTQVTANGIPLYYFSKDKSAGDANGQGIGGVWFVASATGSGSGAGAATPKPSASGYSSY